MGGIRAELETAKAPNKKFGDLTPGQSVLQYAYMHKLREDAYMPDMQRTTLTLPIDLKREARAKAIREGKNLSQVVRELLKEYIKENTPEQEAKT